MSVSIKEMKNKNSGFDPGPEMDMNNNPFLYLSW